ncbi:hypothetical protein F5B22DRAFT_328339 [Xylaria bambusicola]|uniref:uncharacterized protein n=1 Tax=Xylaria bambusicola TaxID=326684 RepID=UPI002007B490|nr:uncharacterized protein F5B22DRAFT_328339 [Xylaria bambusicola]KAI0509410.1 hypothetical protein F5B22DRAFT_328339 [Xylaria bambusicola]
MPTIQATDKQAAANGSDGGSEAVAAGSKHDIPDKTAPDSKRSKKSDGKAQKTIEDTMESSTKDGREPKKGKQASKDEESDVQDSKQGPATGNAEESGARKGVVPSSILEKGIIYFFFRGRVGIDEPSDVKEIQRSLMVLRPLDKDAKLGEGTIQDASNIRLIAVPKKVFPRSGRDRWIAFVEKSDASLKTLKETFLPSHDYETKTAGTRHTPAATPAAEGVYAITTTGRESHLAYMITLPSELGDLQTELGLREKGSFIISTRNPQYDAPRGTALPEGPDYPKEVLDEFRSLRWMPSQPHHLDYANTQFLLVGESSGIEKATEPQKEDEKEGKEKPEEELEKLEDEDTHRMETLRDDDSTAIFADLGTLAKDYPKMRTSFK